MADQPNLTLNILIEKDLPISLLQLYKINIEYILNHINKLPKDTTNTQASNSNPGSIMMDKFPDFVLKNLLSFSQYKHLRRYHELSHAVATNSLKKRKDILKKILPGELTIMAYYLGGSPYLPDDNLDEDLDLPCETIIFVPLLPDPLLSIVSGIDNLLKTFDFPSIFRLTPTNGSTYTSLFNERLLVLPKDIRMKDDLLTILNNCICKYGQCTKQNKTMNPDEENELMAKTGLTNIEDNSPMDKSNNLSVSRNNDNQGQNPLNNITGLSNTDNELNTPESMSIPSNIHIPNNTLSPNKLETFIQSTRNNSAQKHFFPQIFTQSHQKQPFQGRQRKNYKKLSPFSQPVRMKTFDEVMREKKDKRR